MEAALKKEACGDAGGDLQASESSLGAGGRLVEELQLQQCLDEELAPALTSEGTTEIKSLPCTPTVPIPHA